MAIQLPREPEIRAGDGTNKLIIAGRPEEVLLWLSGRRDAAEVTLTSEGWEGPSPPHLAI